MKNIERIEKAYDIKVMRNGFLAIKKKEDKNFKVILPSKNCRLYFMFGNEFNQTTIQELISKRKAIKLTAYELYKLILSENDFRESLDAYDNFRFHGQQAI